MPKIEQLLMDQIYVFVAIEPRESGPVEGIIGENIQGTWYPFVTSKRHIAEGMLKRAKQIQADTGIPFRVLEFSVRKDVTKEFTDD